MGSAHRVIAGGLLGLGMLVGTACSSGSSTSSAKPAAGTGGTTTTSTASSSGDCKGTDTTVTIAETSDATTFDHAAGVSLSGGAAYTVYLSDAEIDPGSISMVNTPKPTDGHDLATVALTVFNAKGTPPPIEAGATIAYTPDFGVLTFRVIDDTVGKTYGQEQNASGDVKVTAVGDTLCFTIDYSDDEKSMSGTVEAPVSKL